MTHSEAIERSGLYVLGALEPSEKRAVDEHLATCPELHAEYAELGGVVPALANLAAPMDAPAGLKSRVLAAVAREAESARVAASVGASSSFAAPTTPAIAPPPTDDSAVKPWELDVDQAPSLAARAAPRGWMGWAAAAMAVALLAVVGVWGLGAQSRADAEGRRAQELAAALQVFGAPDAEVATLRGTGAAAGANGFAAFSPAGDGYVVVSGLATLSSDQTYQAWYLVGDQPFSAGLMSVGDDGMAMLARIPHHSGTNVIALTIEPAGGVAAPTSAPVVAGELRRSA
ncbi:MAG TPA: anti-sigma factor [Candidatus Limnocylindrales bacterium]|nr:anti-sigma factor [Candidatus Limnocylindrales bacterium]